TYKLNSRNMKKKEKICVFVIPAKPLIANALLLPAATIIAAKVTTTASAPVVTAAPGRRF
ncbi:MAG: hypothetical protein ABR585_15605, partial [Gemmatimonadaceae bacterium]